MKPYVRYITLLDSASSAYSIGRHPNEIDWWVPSDSQRRDAVVFGRSRLMYRLLFGDLIRLPRNQAFDSPTWFDAAGTLVRLRDPFFSIALLADRPDPSLFVKDVATQFANKDFFLSAWPGLDYSQRQTISANIMSTGNFLGMLDGIGNLPAPYDEIFTKQQRILQDVLAYVSTHPGSIVLASPPKKSLWERLGDKHIEEWMGCYADDLYSIPMKKSEGENINNRGILYKYITDLEEPIRQALRETIDQQYHYTLAESVANGRIDLSQGLFSHASWTDISQLAHAGDIQYDHRGLRFIDAQSLEKPAKPQGSPLRWEDIFLILDDHDFRERLTNLRRELSSEDHAKAQVALLAHLKYVQELIPSKVVTQSDEDTFTLGIVQGKDAEHLVKIIAGFIPFLSGAFEVLIHKISDKLRENEVERKRNVLAGRVRDWLQSHVDRDYEQKE